MSVTTLLLLALIGLSAGMLSGVIGIGGGVIMVPALLLLGLSQYQAQGTSIGVMLPPIGVLAAWNYYKAGHLDWRYAAVISVFFVVGGYFGSKWAVQLDQRMLKRIFGFVMMAIAAKMIFSK
jgi:hypothetical protein